MNFGLFFITMLSMFLIFGIFGSSLSSQHISRNCSKLATFSHANHGSVKTAFQTGVLCSVSYIDFGKEEFNKFTGVSFRASFSQFKGALSVFHSMYRKLADFVHGQIAIIRKYLCLLTRSLQFLKFLQLGIQAAECFEPRCEGSAFKSEDYYVFRWFLDNWNEGLWHDTEVLLAESTEYAAIIFRGSDSPADLLTNSQTMERVGHSKIFGEFAVGSIHRGMLNAYSRVDTGLVYPLTEQDDSAAIKSSFGRSLPDAYDKCVQKRQVNSTVQGCRLRSTSLALLLKKSAESVLQSGKKLLITGHSLGGALATIFTLDFMINHGVDETEWPKEQKSRRKFPFWLRKETASSKDFSKRIFLYTFGEPDFADETFWNSLQSQHPNVHELVTARYFRYVSLTAGPDCKPDIVTKLVEHVSGLIGERLLGKTNLQSAIKAMMAKIKQRSPRAGKASEADLEISAKDNIKSKKAKSSQTSASKPAAKTEPQRNGTSTVTNNTNVTMRNVPNETFFISQNLNGEPPTQLPSAQQSSNKSNRKDEPALASSKRDDGAKAAKSHRELHAEQEIEEEEEEDQDAQRARLFGQFTLPQRIHVCSGSALNEVEAHSLWHYLGGIVEEVSYPGLVHKKHNSAATASSSILAAPVTPVDSATADRISTAAVASDADSGVVTKISGGAIGTATTISESRIPAAAPNSASSPNMPTNQQQTGGQSSTVPSPIEGIIENSKSSDNSLGRNNTKTSTNPTSTTQQLDSSTSQSKRDEDVAADTSTARSIASSSSTPQLRDSTQPAAAAAAPGAIAPTRERRNKKNHYKLSVELPQHVADLLALTEFVNSD